MGQVWAGKSEIRNWKPENRLAGRVLSIAFSKFEFVSRLRLRYWDAQCEQTNPGKPDYDTPSRISTCLPTPRLPEPRLMAQPLGTSIFNFQFSIQATL
jgi:hypothetical protein